MIICIEKPWENPTVNHYRPLIYNLFIEEVTRKYGRTAENPLRVVERHFPNYVPVTGKKSNPTRKCVVCSKATDSKGKKCRRESRYQCTECDVGLCVTPCFKKYHTVENYYVA